MRLSGLQDAVAGRLQLTDHGAGEAASELLPNYHRVVISSAPAILRNIALALR